MTKKKIKQRYSSPLNLTFGKRKGRLFFPGGEIEALNWPAQKPMGLAGSGGVEGNKLNLFEKLGVILSNVPEEEWSKIGNMAGSVVSGATSIANSAMRNAEIMDTSGIEAELDEKSNLTFEGAGDNDSLLNAWNDIDWQKNDYTQQDVRGVSGGEMVGNTLSAIGSGASAGASVGGGYGAIARAIAGLGSSLAGIFAGNSKAKKKALELNQAADYANRSMLSRFNYQADKIQDNMYNDMMKNIMADGGHLFSDKGIHIKKKNRGKFTESANRAGMGVQEYARHVLANKEKYSPTLVKRANFARNAAGWKHDMGGYMFSHGADWNNGLMTMDTGGSHEANPYGGIPMGIAPDNQPNLVEQGEVIYNDYVFSNRLAPTKKELKDINLPERYGDSSFAYIAENMSKESSERPNDPISRKGLEDSLGKLMLIQEKQRAEKGKRGTQQMMALGGHKFSGENDRKLNTYSNFEMLPENTTFYTPEYLGFWDYLSKNRDSDIGKRLLEDINKEKYGKVGGNTFTLDDILKLSRDGMKGPVHQAFMAYLPKYRGIALNTFTDNMEEEVNDLIYEDIKKELQRPVDNTPKQSTSQTESTEIPVEYLDTSLRYAPAIGSAMGAISSIFAKPDYEHSYPLEYLAHNLSRREVRPRYIGDYLTYTPLDRNYYLNQLRGQAGATRRAIINSGLNSGQAMASLLAADHNAQNAVGNTLMQMEQYNQNQRERVGAFNRGTNQYNSQAGMTVDAQNAGLAQNRDQMKASLLSNVAQMRENSDAMLEQSRSMNLTNMFDNLGNIGRENFIFNQVRSNPSLLYNLENLKGVSRFVGRDGGMLTKKNRRRKK